MLRKYDLRLQALIGIVVASAMMVATLSWSYVLYLRLYDTIVDGYDQKLLAICGVTGSFIDGDAHATLVESRDETSAAYRKLTAPMKTILKKAELTYVYTQLLVDEPECMYVLDATEGEDHTEIGYIDELPPEDYAGAQRVLDGGIHIGAVEETDHWGMIKVSYAPIFDSDGEIKAMAGADVNLDVIKMKTRIALLAAFGLGVIVLSIGVYASIAVARRLTEPLNVLKEGALKLASGHYDHRIEVKKPQELALLAETFNDLNDDLVGTLESQRNDHQRTRDSQERLARMEVLENQLPVNSPTDSPTSELSQSTVLTLLNSGDSRVSRTSSNWVACGNELVVWMGLPQADALKSLEQRSVLTESLRRIILHGAQDRDEGSHAEIAEILEGQTACFLRYRAGEDSAWMHPFQPTDVWHWDGEKVTAETVRAPGSVRLPLQGSLIFTDANEPLSDAFQDRLAEEIAVSIEPEERLAQLRSLLEQVTVKNETLFGAVFHPGTEPRKTPQ
jgi:HAMP domain-containing protein